jgi:hypothetical protein
MKLALVLAALAACNKPAPPPAAPPPVTACARVADHLVGLMSGATKHPPEATDPLRRVIGERCEQDKWSADSTQCLLSLTSLADGARCQAMMTPAQIETFQRESEAATVELRGQFAEEPKRPDSPADAAGSD